MYGFLCKLERLLLNPPYCYFNKQKYFWNYTFFLLKNNGVSFLNCFYYWILHTMSYRVMTGHFEWVWIWSRAIITSFLLTCNVCISVSPPLHGIQLSWKVYLCTRNIMVPSSWWWSRVVGSGISWRHIVGQPNFFLTFNSFVFVLI